MPHFPAGVLMKKITIPAFVLTLALFLAACEKKSTEEQAPPEGNQPATTSSPGAAAGGRESAMKQAEAKATPAPVVVPSGAVLTVRLGETLSSKTAEAGQGFSATLAKAVMVGEKEAIPAGATCAGTVTSAKSAGKFKGGASLALKLNSITVGGNTYDIQTSGVAQATKGKGKRTAAMIGGGAGAGALIGGLAGGGKGAAIGALVGGGAGTAGSAFTGNRDITLPAETALSFTLATPLELKTK